MSSNTPARRPVAAILEDDADIAAVFRRALDIAGFEVIHAPSVAAFDAMLDERAPTCAPALAILDLGLPDGDGLEVLSGRLAAGRTPCIVVSGRGDIDDRLAGLDRGADDYLVKPVDPRELAARARTVLRRRGGEGAGILSNRFGEQLAREQGAPRADELENGPSAAPARATAPSAREGARERDLARFGAWRVDFAKLSLTAPDGEEEAVSPAEALLLRTFLAAPGRVLSRAQLLDACLGGADDVFDRSIDVRVSRLRKRLRSGDPEGVHIKTVYGAGYVFTSPVSWGVSEQS